MMAHEVPQAYAHRMPDGSLCVDYNSLLAELWAGVRCLCDRLETQERVIANMMNASPL